MAKTSKKHKLEIELEPDAWPHFERFIKEVAKAGPQHRKSKPREKNAEKKNSENDG